MNEAVLGTNGKQWHAARNFSPELLYEHQQAYQTSCARVSLSLSWISADTRQLFLPLTTIYLTAAGRQLTIVLPLGTTAF